MDPNIIAKNINCIMLSICAAMIQLARNPYAKQVLQAIANPNWMIL